MGIEHINGKNKGEVMLYALSTCGWCSKTKELLRELCIEFDYTYVDLLEGKEHDDVMNVVERFNPAGSFPTLVINDKKCIIGFREQDLDIICPCDYRDPDLNDFGACYCALYVSDAIANGGKISGPVPDRRPPRSERGTLITHTIPLSASSSPTLPLPVWRCKVCGYLCAREQPPEICPICKVTKDRFERFM